MSTNSGVYYKYYHYDPSLAAGCVFAVLFGILTVWHTILVVRYRTWSFIPVIIGGICTYLFSPLVDFGLTSLLTVMTAVETAGYIARAVSHSQSPHLTLGPYVIQALLLLVAPPLFAASLYMTLSRIIERSQGWQYSLIKKRWLTTTFVTGDVVCFVVQLGGTQKHCFESFERRCCAKKLR
jgi:hypothetical protein